MRPKSWKSLVENRSSQLHKVVPAKSKNMSVLCNHKSLYIRWRLSLPSNRAAPPLDCLLVQKALSCRHAGLWLVHGKSTLTSARLKSHVLVCFVETKNFFEQKYEIKLSMKWINYIKTKLIREGESCFSRNVIENVHEYFINFGIQLESFPHVY